MAKKTLQSDSEDKQIDGGYNVTRPYRFPKMSALLSKYERTRLKRGSMRSWINIQKAYDRVPIKLKGEEQLVTDYGQLRFRVDQAMTTYVDFATERETWARITTDEGLDVSQNALWSEQITFAFQKFCIKPWVKGFAEIMRAVKDMLLFSKGVFLFPEACGCYPESIAIEHVWPDEEAGMFPDDFDVVFIERRYTAEQLYKKIRDPKQVQSTGWNKAAVMKLLKNTNTSFKDMSHDTLAMRFQEGRCTSEQQDAIIDVVIAFVKEFEPDENAEADKDSEPGEYGYTVSQYIFPKRAHMPSSARKQKQDEIADGIGYLQKGQKSYECMEQALSIVAHSVCRNFYEDPSFANVIYTASKTYNVVMNRILQAIEDNMRLYLTSDTTETFKKLAKLRHGNAQVLPPGVKIAQERIERPVRDAFQALRTTMIDVNAGTGQYTVGEQSNTGGAKTATQSNIDLGESTRIGSAQLKLFNAFCTLLLQEMYRRFTTCMEDYNCGYKRFVKFKKYLKKRNVPDAAWDPENVEVASLINMGAGSPAMKLQSAQVTLQAMAVAPRSPGERQAQRNLIAAVQGVENVDLYIPKDDDLSVPEDSLIGLENDSLSEPRANPKNVQVLAHQLHMRHISSHIDDANLSLKGAYSLFQNLDQFPKEDEGVHLMTIQDILQGIDNKLAHTWAHIQMAHLDATKSKQVEIKGFTDLMGEINKQFDNLSRQLGQIQAKRLADSQKVNGLDPEVEHQKVLNQLNEEHTARMLAFDYQKGQLKGEQLRQNSAANAEHKQTLDTAATIHKMNKDELVAAAKVRQNAIVARGKATSKPA